MAEIPIYSLSKFRFSLELCFQPGSKESFMLNLKCEKMKKKLLIFLGALTIVLTVSYFTIPKAYAVGEEALCTKWCDPGGILCPLRIGFPGGEGYVVCFEMTWPE